MLSGKAVFVLFINITDELSRFEIIIPKITKIQNHGVLEIAGYF